MMMELATEPKLNRNIENMLTVSHTHTHTQRLINLPLTNCNGVPAGYLS